MRLAQATKSCLSARAAPRKPCGLVPARPRSSERARARASRDPQPQRPEGEAGKTPEAPQAGAGAGGSGSAATSAAKLVAEVVASPIFYLVAGLVAIKLVASTGEQSLSIFLFAAAPITLLTALSKSSLGKQVQDALTEKLPQLEAEAEATRQRHAAARAASPWFGPNRPQLPAALGGCQPHLTGEVAGDYGFDPLGLAREPAAFRRMHEVELLHARWAMLGAVGALVPEALSISGVELGEPVWWKVGAAKLSSDLTLNWGGIEGFRIAGKQGIGIIAACQAVLMGGPEYARYVGIKSLEPVGVFLPGCPDANYPGGGPFDPLNFSGDAEGYVEQQVKEIKNGRLAMLAFLGYFAQAAATREGPVQNLRDALGL
ncbi:chlorophyll a,b-binding protein [Raphidocelis subcapitata]|uniref:Chlorophyll a-b binding protein, chloroplastic n=1 Tax=Raphidocelis subcapitata TaxID=307507 RepID=A0A2V0NW98_9CHLO|nr:chlorophyll a,b-binding protein [Raphidocelis subcapitata]|eukprot:GBF91914.1 chlorophyll a,b-binding protein [Raphidocelis subcapitata]